MKDIGTKVCSIILNVVLMVSRLSVCALYFGIMLEIKLEVGTVTHKIEHTPKLVTKIGGKMNTNTHIQK